MYPDLKDKVVMITGAAGNIGRFVSIFFDKEGSKLALVDHKMEYFESGFGDGLKDSWLLKTADITNHEQVEKVMSDSIAYFGGIDVLINVAGGYVGGGSILETSEETWDKQMNLNAKSVFLMSRAAAKAMVERGQGGRIISIGAKPGLQGTGNHTAYSASKSAVLRLTESMSVELKKYRINVNAIIPSSIDTPPNRKATPDADFSKWVTPESIAGVLAFLASDASRDISGALIPVYGG